MKKIPGTLYNIQIKKNQDSKYIVEVWNKDQIIYEKSGITDQSEIIEILLEFLEKEDFILPRNRLEWVIKDELENVEIEKDKSFAEKTVSMMMGEIEKKTR